MLSMTVKIGEAIQIGDVACLAIDEKSGNRVRVRIGNPLRLPIKIHATGIIPRFFTTGITGERQPHVPPTQQTPELQVA